MKFIPKVGEECQTGIGKGVVKVESDKYGICCVEILGELKLIHCDSLHAIKTPAEIERDEAINKLLKIINGGDGDKWSLDLANKLYDAGFGKQQVKPLSKQDAMSNLGISDWQYKQLVKLGHTIQGGDK